MSFLISLRVFTMLILNSESTGLNNSASGGMHSVSCLSFMRGVLLQCLVTLACEFKVPQMSAEPPAVLLFH